MRTISKAMFVLASLATFFVYANKLDLSKHRMTTGGQAQITYDSGNITTTGVLEADVNLNYGYFVFKNFLVQLNMEIGSSFYLFPAFRGTLGPSVLYAFDTNSMASPYLEFGSGITLRQAGARRWGAALRPAVGVLLALNSSLALD